MADNEIEGVLVGRGGGRKADAAVRADIRRRRRI